MSQETLQHIIEQQFFLPEGRQSYISRTTNAPTNWQPLITTLVEYYGIPRENITLDGPIAGHKRVLTDSGVEDPFRLHIDVQAIKVALSEQAHSTSPSIFEPTDSSPVSALLHWAKTHKQPITAPTQQTTARTNEELIMGTETNRYSKGHEFRKYREITGGITSLVMNGEISQEYAEQETGYSMAQLVAIDIKNNSRFTKCVEGICHWRDAKTFLLLKLLIPKKNN